MIRKVGVKKNIVPIGKASKLTRGSIMIALRSLTCIKAPGMGPV
jgi:hypothetical protein